ncbi:Vegetative incompatibility protein HET-E-1 [Lachnellula arida]|uniref:Vegetative incompatibility protein HET-E-1 n=1 Tax=Lachnellula arida TaxID=1316785 RepID=A0A8T9B6J5_9HELO|nr:Vegetative incompatibility protein HET-E-1 [Lachnellula arida]
MNPISNTFDNVLTDFKKRLTAKELENFQFVTLEDVRQTILRIQNDQEHLKEMRDMTRIESFLEAMAQFGKTIEVFTASTWADSFELLLDAYSQIGEHMPLLEQYKDVFGTNDHMKRVLTLLYTDILDFHRRAIRFFSGRVWQQLFRSVWKNFGTCFTHILDSLSRHKNLIVEQAALLYFQQYQSNSQATLLHIQQYERDRLETRNIQKQHEQDELHQRYLNVLQWLSAAPSTLEDHNTFHGIRCNGSGDWILKHEKVQNWRELETPVSSILWLNGIPGAGKTILASVIIDACIGNKACTTTYFYCKENDSEKNDCISVFRALLKQLLGQCMELVPYCYDKISSTGELTLTTTALAEQLLKIFFEKLGRQFIVIDGLDECDLAQRKLLLSFFTKMVDHCDERDPGKLRVLFVSQSSPDIEKALQLATVLRLTAEDNKNDIATYVGHWCTKIQRKYDLESSTVEFIRESTCLRASGMFLFAKLVLDHLYALETKMNILNEIKTYGFPEGLEEAYERIIRRLKQQLRHEQWSIARKLLGWMVCAKRPLNWREIQAVVSMDIQNQSIELDKRKLRSNIQDYCGSLIQVSDGDRVELVHTTAKMYVISSGYVNRPTVEFNLAAICLQYLTFECFDNDISPDDLRSSAMTGILAFQDYAVAKWAEHIRCIVKGTPKVFGTDVDSQAAIQEMECGLEDFVGCYEGDLQEAPLTDKAEQECEAFRNFRFFENLLYVWSHIYCHDEKGPQVRDDVSMKALNKSFSRNRKLLEDMSLELPPYTGLNQDLAAFYGEKRFKCSKPRCYYFHEGFKDAQIRKTHINRHDRPFNCDFPDCSIAIFGFTSNKDLEKHRLFFHPEMVDEATMFADEARPTAATRYTSIEYYR